MVPAPESVRPRVTNANEAERMVRGILDTMTALENLMNEETALVKGGRLSDALAREQEKSGLASTYMKSLEALKANAVALARFAPAALEDLKRAHSRFSGAIEKNQTVLATARAVSESLVRSLAEEINGKSRPNVYAPPSQVKTARPSGSGPMIMSKKL